MITGKLARAARALIEWPRDYVANRAGIDAGSLGAFEAGHDDPGDLVKARLQAVLEEGGAVFLAEEPTLGVGVRLKFTALEVRAINRLEGEGGPVGSDDV